MAKVVAEGLEAQGDDRAQEASGYAAEHQIKFNEVKALYHQAQAQGISDPEEEQGRRRTQDRLGELAVRFRTARFQTSKNL